jgi:hypothetical protein
MNPCHPTRVLFALGALLALPLALAGCDTIDFLTPDFSSPPAAGEMEIIPVVQNPRTEIWRPGYWEPRGDDGFNWVPGEIVPRPSPTAVWKSAVWAHHIYGWTFEEGHWE